MMSSVPSRPFLHSVSKDVLEWRGRPALVRDVAVSAGRAHADWVRDWEMAGSHQGPDRKR